jgi:hypothetical protein
MELKIVLLILKIKLLQVILMKEFSEIMDGNNQLAPVDLLLGI